MPATASTSEGLLAALRPKLLQASAPLTVAEAAKGLKKAKGTTTAALQEQVRTVLDEEVREGRVYSYPSGAKGAVRYWSRDEKQFLRDKILELAETPLAIPAFAKVLKTLIRGVDPGFVEATVRELIGDDRLYEHPTQKGGPRFGAAPPPPPPPVLEQPANAKKVDKLLGECRKLMSATGAGAAELIEFLQRRLREEPRVPEAADDPTFDIVTPPIAPASRNDQPTPDALILKSLEQASILSIADLRRGMPSAFRGEAFDEAVLRLADARRVYVTQDSHPEHYTEEELAEFVRDGDSYFTTIAKGD